MKPYKFSFPADKDTLRVGIIINPTSGGINASGIRLAQELERSDCDIPYFLLENFSCLSSVLHDFASRGVTVLFISSGDGTIQAIQTLLLEADIFSPLPYLVLLPHGSTNMTARRLGWQGAFLGKHSGSFVSFLSSFGDTKSRILLDCPTIRILHASDGIERYGMFLGCGIVTNGVDYCQSQLHNIGFRGEFANFIAFLRMLIAFFRSRFSDDSDIVRPISLRLFSGDTEMSCGSHFCISITTLDRLILRMRPWYGGVKNGQALRGDNGLHITIVGSPPPSLFRWLIPLLYGGSRRFSSAPSGCVGLCSDSVRIASPTSIKFILDGEFFWSSASTPLEIQCGPILRYIVS